VGIDAGLVEPPAGPPDQLLQRIFQLEGELTAANKQLSQSKRLNLELQAQLLSGRPTHRARQSSLTSDPSPVMPDSLLTPNNGMDNHSWSIIHADNNAAMVTQQATDHTASVFREDNARLTKENDSLRAETGRLREALDRAKRDAAVLRQAMDADNTELCLARADLDAEKQHAARTKSSLERRIAHLEEVIDAAATRSSDALSVKKVDSSVATSPVALPDPTPSPSIAVTQLAHDLQVTKQSLDAARRELLDYQSSHTVPTSLFELVQVDCERLRSELRGAREHAISLREASLSQGLVAAQLKEYKRRADGSRMHVAATIAVLDQLLGQLEGASTAFGARGFSGSVVQHIDAWVSIIGLVRNFALISGPAPSERSERWRGDDAFDDGSDLEGPDDFIHDARRFSSSHAAALQNTVDQWLRRLTTKAENSERGEMELTAMRDELRSFESALRQAKTEALDAESQARDLRRELDLAQDRSGAQLAEVARARDEAVQRQKALEKRLDDAQLEAPRLRGELSALQIELDATRSRLNDAQRALDAEKRRSQERQREHDDQAASLAAQSQRAADVKWQDGETLRRRLRDAEHRLADSQAAVAQRDAMLADISADVAAMRDELLQLRDAVNRPRDPFGSAGDERQIVALTQRIAELEIALDDARNAELEARDAAVAADGRCREAEAAADADAALIQSLRKEIAAFERRVSALESERDPLRRRLHDQLGIGKDRN
jgi:hypothetical protein